MNKTKTKTAVICKFTVPRFAKNAVRNAVYITRESATLGDEYALHLHNLHTLRGIDYRETRTRILSYVEARLDEEQCQSKHGRGQARSYYTCVLSFDRKEQTSIAVALSAQFLKEVFPNARAVVSCHQNTSHTHCHVFIDARQVDNRKIQLSKRVYERLDEQWARIYALQYGPLYEVDHVRKKEEIRAFKRALARGEQPAPPLSNSRKGLTRAEYQRREWKPNETLAASQLTHNVLESLARANEHELEHPIQKGRIR
jgi:hypothetical protein